jgi:hypothetical protein
MLDLDIGRTSRLRRQQQNQDGEDMAHGENEPPRMQRVQRISCPLHE